MSDPQPTNPISSPPRTEEESSMGRKIMMSDPPPMNPISSPPRTEEESSILKRTCSMPVESAVHSPTPASPSRATFPFKPASTLIALQKSQSTIMDNDSVQHDIVMGRSSSHDECHLPATFRPRPVVPVFHLQLQPRRCATFPVDSQSESQIPCPPPEAPDWVVSREKPTPIQPFPIPANSPAVRDCWWLHEMAGILERKPSTSSTVVQVGDDEIELVESEEDATDEINTKEEIQVTGFEVESTSAVLGVEQPKDVKENNAAIDISATAPSFSSLKISDDSTILQDEIKDLVVEIEQAKDLDPEKKSQMEKFLQQFAGAIQMDKKKPETINGAESGSAVDAEKNKVQTNEATPNAIDHIRRTAVGITGGALTVAGVVLIPCPVIPGGLVVYGGLMLLATEFDGAKMALDTMKEPVKKWLADEDVEDENAAEDAMDSTSMWEELIGYKPDDNFDIDDEFEAMMNKRSINRNANNGQKSTDNTEKAKNNSLKPFLRKLLQLDSFDEGDANNKNEDDRKASQENAPAGPDDSTRSKVGQSENSVNPLSPCHSIDLSGCQIMSFDFGGDDGNDTSDDANGKPHLRQNNVSLHRICSGGSITMNTLNEGLDETVRLFSRQNTANEDKLFSDGSITLNTLNDPDESFRFSDEAIQMFSRQNSPHAIDDGCLFVLSNGINDLLQEGSRPDGLAIEKES